MSIELHNPQVVPAQPGYFLVDFLEGDKDNPDEIFLTPIIAWEVSLGKGEDWLYPETLPITPFNTDRSSEGGALMYNRLIKLPDGRFLDSEECGGYADEKAAIEWFKAKRQRLREAAQRQSAKKTGKSP
jgi:hypothetical protein